MDNFTSFFSSSADIFQKLALKFQTFLMQIRWDISYNLMFANVINMCQNFANTRKASLMLQFSILRLCLLMANFIACCKGCFTYTPNPNRNRTETVTATELHRFVFGRPFTYEPNPWTKCKKMPVYFGLISLSDSRNTFTIQIVSCHCIKFVIFIVALGIVPQTSVVNSIVLVK